MWFSKIHLANRGVRQPVQPHNYAQLLIFDEVLAQPDFAVVNSSDVVMSVFYSRFNVQPDIFAVMNCYVVALSAFSTDILTWSADSLYSVQWHKKGECVYTNMHIVSTNFAEMLVWKHVKFWRHKQHTANTNDHPRPLNETPNENFLRTPLPRCDIDYIQNFTRV